MGFCSARSWTCPSAWKRPRPSRQCPGQPCWWCWSQPWRRRRWWARAPPPPGLPFDSHSSWRCWEARQMLDKCRKRKMKQSGLDLFCFFCRCDRCVSEAARSPCQMTELTQTVWAAAGSAWVNISWGPQWIGQHAEFRTKLLTHCLNSRLASQSRDKMIIYYSHTAQAVNLSNATGLIGIMCFYKSAESTVNNVAVQRRLLIHYLITPRSLYTTGVFTLRSGLLCEGRRKQRIAYVNWCFVCDTRVHACAVLCNVLYIAAASSLNMLVITSLSLWEVRSTWSFHMI